MRRLFTIAAISMAVLSAAGCSEQNSQPQAVIADLQQREKVLIEQCRKIATDRNLLLAKLEAMKSVYAPSMKREPEPDRIHECSAFEDEKSNVKTSAIAPASAPNRKTPVESGAQGVAVKNYRECRDLDGAPCREFLTDEDIAEADRILERKSARSLCWEGYCPCDLPQGGPDQLLCDSLRRGEVDVKMLSVGKSMRSARAEMSGY
jgi:hypothetical protein